MEGLKVDTSVDETLYEQKMFAVREGIQPTSLTCWVRFSSCFSYNSVDGLAGRIKVQFWRAFTFVLGFLMVLGLG